MLAVVALAVGWIAYLQSVAAKAAQAEERKQRELVQTREAQQRKLLHEASMADYAVAVQRIEKEGKWHEGVAHLARALDLEPTNSLAAAWLYSTFLFHEMDQASSPRQILRHEGRVNTARFSPDGSRIVTTSDDNTARFGKTQLASLLANLSGTNPLF